MVRDDDRVGAGVDRPPGVVTGHDALGEDRAGPQVADPFEVLPSGRRGNPVEEGVAGGHRLAGAAERRRVHEAQLEAVVSGVEQPPRAHGDLRRHLLDGAAVELERRVQAHALFPLAVAGQLRVECHGQGTEAGVPGPGHQLLGSRPAPEEVELEPGRMRRRRHDVVHRVAGHGAEGADRARLTCCPGAGDVPERVHHPRETDRAQKDRHGHFEAEDRGREHRRGHTLGDAEPGAELDRFDRGLVRPHRGLGPGSALDVVVDGPRHAAPGEPARIGHRHDLRRSPTLRAVVILVEG